MTKLLYGITALILALALGGFAVQAARLSKAENRAVEATKLAGEYQRSLESLERAVEAQEAKFDAGVKRQAQLDADIDRLRAMRDRERGLER